MEKLHASAVLVQLLGIWIWKTQRFCVATLRRDLRSIMDLCHNYARKSVDHTFFLEECLIFFYYAEFCKNHFLKLSHSYIQLCIPWKHNWNNVENKISEPSSQWNRNYLLSSINCQLWHKCIVLYKYLILP